MKKKRAVNVAALLHFAIQLPPLRLVGTGTGTTGVWGQRVRWCLLDIIDVA